MNLDELKGLFASMTSAERAAIVGTPQTFAGPRGPKWTPIINAVPEDELDEAIKLVAAISKCKTAEESKEATSALGEAYPDLLTCIKDNSAYRGKPISHSLNTALVRLTIRK